MESPDIVCRLADGRFQVFIQHLLRRTDVLCRHFRSPQRNTVEILGVFAHGLVALATNRIHDLGHSPIQPLLFQGGPGDDRWPVFDIRPFYDLHID